MDPFQDEPQQGGGGFDIMGLVRAFWRRKLLFFVPFILCLSMAAVAIKTMTPIYASTGQILIKFEGLNSRLLTDPSNRFGRPQYIDAVAFQEMNMLLTSPDFLQKMVLELRLQDALREEAQKEGEPPLTDEQAIRKARGKLAGMVRLKQDGQRLFKFEVRDPDPEQAYRLASFILDRFVEEYRETQTASSTSMRDFLQRQLEVYNTKLANAEQALTEFQASIASEALVDNPINASNLGYAQASVQALRERYDGTDARELQDLTAGVSRLLGNVPNVSRYRSDDIIRSTGQEMENLGLENQLYSPNSRESRDVETRLGQLRVRLNTRIEQMVGEQFPQLGYLERNQVSHFVYFTLYREGSQRVINDLEAKIREFRDFTTRRPAQSARIAELQDDVTAARGMVSTIENEITSQTLNLEASGAELGMQIRIRQAPILDGNAYIPVEPNKIKLTALGSVLSLAIGLGLVVLAIFLDRSFKTVEDIERTLGLPVIGTLPVIQDDHFERKKKVRLLRWATIILGIIAVGAVGFLVIYPRLG